MEQVFTQKELLLVVKNHVESSLDSSQIVENVEILFVREGEKLNGDIDKKLNVLVLARVSGEALPRTFFYEDLLSRIKRYTVNNKYFTLRIEPSSKYPDSWDTENLVIVGCFE
jgi:hypothetical protein